MNATLSLPLNKGWPKPAAEASAWPEIVSHRKPVIRAWLTLQGETPVDPQGFLVAGFVLPAPRIIRVILSCMADIASRVSSFLKWVKAHPKTSVFGGLALLILIPSLIASALLTPEQRAQMQAQNQLDVSHQDPATKLASLELGVSSLTAADVVPYDDMLTRLQTKCPDDTRFRIASYLFEMKKLIENQYGIQTTYAQDADALYNAIPADAVGVVKCSEISAVLVATWK